MQPAMTELVELDAETLGPSPPLGDEDHGNFVIHAVCARRIRFSVLEHARCRGGGSAIGEINSTGWL
jgi:hypothetical protein